MTISYPASSVLIPDADRLREIFDGATSFTVGLEEEAMLLDAESLALLPRATEVLERLGGDPRYKLELPASQVEIVLPPSRTVAESAAALAAARRDLVAAARGIGVLAAAGAHPLAAPLGKITDTERHRAIAREYGIVAEAQQVGALQVHVAVPGHERALAVYDALRSYLPELAALAGNAPFFGGLDTGLASIRPKVCDLLPRQGVPPAISSWEEYAAGLRWGATVDELPATARWWWELRPHPVHGTLEMRVPDAQSTVQDAAAVAAFAQSLAFWLAGRHDAGELEPADPTWRIEENRWQACRHGLDARISHLRDGSVTGARELLHERVETLLPSARELDCEAELLDVRRLLEANGAERQRAEGDAHGAARLLAHVYKPATEG
jgi:carboxylate-amine ligase